MPEPESTEVVRLDWSNARDTVAVPANVVIVQRSPDEVHLAFGHAPPPVDIAEMNEKEVDVFLHTNGVVVQQVVRVALTPGAASLLLNNLLAIGVRTPAGTTSANKEESE